MKRFRVIGFDFDARVHALTILIQAARSQMKNSAGFAALASADNVKQSVR